MQAGIELIRNLLFSHKCRFSFISGEFCVSCCPEGNTGECTAFWQMVLKLGRFFRESAAYWSSTSPWPTRTGRWAQQALLRGKLSPSFKSSADHFLLPASSLIRFQRVYLETKLMLSDFSSHFSALLCVRAVKKVIARFLVSHHHPGKFSSFLSFIHLFSHVTEPLLWARQCAKSWERSNEQRTLTPCEHCSCAGHPRGYAWDRKTETRASKTHTVANELTDF